MLASVFLMAGFQSHATVTIDLRKGFGLNWYFHNTSDKYTNPNFQMGYYRDYNGDGLPDYLLCLKDSDTEDWRLFALDTAPTGEKTYPADKTAGRDFTAQPGVFVPYVLWKPFDHTQDSQDLVIVGTDQASAAPGASYTQLKFKRLDKTSTTFPDEATWTINTDSAYSPELYWPDLSFNSDSYPDFIIYNSVPNASGKFVITAYNGLTGAQLWTKTLDLDSEDTGAGFGFSMGLPILAVSTLPLESSQDASGDFDGNGKVELFLSYTFGKGNFMSSYSMVADINLLNPADGSFVSPYTSTWTRVRDASNVSSAPGTINAYDLNKDGYVDMILANMVSTSTPPQPVVEGYDLKNRVSLFKTTSSDFGTTPADSSGFMSAPQMSFNPMKPADANGDGYVDLDIYQEMDTSMSRTGVRVGLFNAYAGGTTDKGRKMWLKTFSGFDQAFWCLNDFDGNNLDDFVLLKNPAAPNTVTAGQVTWHVANTAVTPSDMTVAKEFNYSTPHSFSWNAATDKFHAYSGHCAYFGDVDGDGQNDTSLCTACDFDKDRDGTTDLAYGCIVIYDNTPAAQAPDYTAEMAIKVENEDWIPMSGMTSAYTLSPSQPVDNNQDGSANDVVVLNDQMVLSLSFDYKPIVKSPAGAEDWEIYR
jgi:hypothetical protein